MLFLIIIFDCKSMVNNYLSDLKHYPTLNIIKYHSEGICNNGILLNFIILFR